MDKQDIEALEALGRIDHLSNPNKNKLYPLEAHRRIKNNTEIIRTALTQASENEVIIEGLSQIIESQKQTHGVLIKRLADSEDAVRDLAEALELARQRLDAIGYHETAKECRKPLSKHAATIKNVGGA